MFMGPILPVFSVLNSVAILYGATAALPFGSILLLFLIHTFIAVPFLALGGIIGHHYNSGRKSLPSPKRFPREIPPLTWYKKTPGQMLLGGLLPFSGILVELHLFYASLWSYKVFTQLSVLFVTFVILICLTSVFSIGLTYIQLNGEDPRWWCRSVLRGGSTAIFMFGYSIYFYSRSNMSGLMQLSYFLGVNVCVCYALFRCSVQLVSVLLQCSGLTFIMLLRASKFLPYESMILGSQILNCLLRLEKMVTWRREGR